jgi:hypothetical protein
VPSQHVGIADAESDQSIKQDLVPGEDSDVEERSTGARQHGDRAAGVNSVDARQ